ncbi:MAG: penicillin-binding transpeptidase domain-containing protein [Bacteroidetes bacterium]|jgi:cell division protein FtsI (penicillin-binding protein 3)|nr:penicillin-binding transpeptidase domain-containing protein [Bacteroidota bacterium]
MNEPVAATPDPARGFRARFLLLKFFFALFFLVIGGRLVMVQVLDAGKYRALAKKQYEQRFVLPALRGNLVDRNGSVLASNTMFVSFAADPKIVGDDARRVAKAFAQVFGKPGGFYLEKLGGPSGSDRRRFVWMERSVRPEMAKRVAAAHLPGIVMMNEPRRLYHYDHVGGALLGFTDLDHRGISGIELALNADLKGSNGSVTLQRDGLGRSRPSADYPRIEPVNGHDVDLTLDIEYQAVAEEELRRGLEINGADGGLAVLMNPRTGEILALAVAPGVNPNAPGAVDASRARIRAVTDIFEPGSTFKVVTAAAAYEHHLVQPEERFYAERGTMKVTIGRYTRLIKDTHEHDWLTFRESMEVSSNIVMAKVGKVVGPERLYDMARNLGFGVPTGIDIPGEVRGTLKRPSTWSGTTLQTMAYGYEVGVTPVQMLSAYGAVANGGVLVRPYVVRSVRTPSGDVVRSTSPTVIRRVMSVETAKRLTEAFEGVVERGTATDVRIPGVRIAGKTGTARKVIEGSYASGSYTASFVGFFPADDPQVVGVVMMDNPRTRGFYGGVTSGPIFRAIAERIVNSSSRISRSVMTQRDPHRDRVLSVPDVRSMQPEFARQMLASMGLNGRVFGDGAVIAKQIPEAGHPAEPGDVVSLVLGTALKPAANGLVAVPDVRGLSVRRAMTRLVVDEFDVDVRGSGIVRQQMPAAGTAAKAGASVTLVCEPRSMTTAVLY